MHEPPGQLLSRGAETTGGGRPTQPGPCSRTPQPRPPRPTQPYQLPAPTSTHPCSSSVAVYVAERRSRQQFLLAAACGQRSLAEAAAALGLPTLEVLEAMAFDPAAAYALCGALLLPVAACTWLATLALSQWLLP